MIVLAFIVDTASTLVGGSEMLAGDVNPLVRPLSLPAYIAWSVIRFAIALTLLTWAWPGPLDVRTRLQKQAKWLPFLIPFSCVPVGKYLVAMAVAAIGPLKLVASASNTILILIGRPLMPAWIILGMGIVLGFATSNALIAWHQTLASNSKPED